MPAEPAADREDVPERAADVQSGPDARGRILVPALIVLVGLALFAYVRAHAPLIPICDAWTWIAHAKAYAEGGLDGLWAQRPLIHTQHIYALPSAVAFFVGPLVDYSMRPFAFACVALLFACGLLSYAAARGAGLGRYGALAVFLAAASFRHHENLYFGFQFGVIASVVFATAAIVVADRRRNGAGLALALVCALLSLSCSSAGVFAIAAVIAVRWIDPRRARMLGGLALAAAAVLLVLHLVLSQAFGQSFVGEALAQVSLERAPRIARDFVRLAGGGLIGGHAATPAGLVILSLAIGHLAVRTRFESRIDAQSGLLLFGLAATLTIAIARSPFDTPDSRHAIFTVPLVTGAAIDVVRWLAAWAGEVASLRARSAVALAVLLGWLHADAYVDAIAFHEQVVPWELDTRIYTAAMAGDGKLKPEEVYQVNPGETETIRELMAFARDRQLTIFSPSYHGMAVANVLPTQHQGEVQTALEDGALRSSGNGYVFERTTCTFPSGGIARLSVDVALRGRANLGFLVRNAATGKDQNVGAAIKAAGDGFAVHSFRADVAPGDEIDAYVFTWSDADEVRIRSFSTAMVQRSPGP